MYTKLTIENMTNKVLVHIAAKHNEVKEGVQRIMGGKVLDYEAKTILNLGREEGREEGRKEGRAEGVRREIFTSVQEGDYGVARGAEKLGIPIEKFIERMKEEGYKVPQ